MNLIKVLKDSRAYKALAGLSLLALSQLSHAQGWIQGFNNVTALGRAGVTTVTVVCFMLGLIAIAFGGKLLWDKGGERGEDIKPSRIVFTFIGGAVLVALGFIALQTVLTMGGTQADMGAAVAPQ